MTLRPPQVDYTLLDLWEEVRSVVLATGKDLQQELERRSLSPWEEVPPRERQAIALAVLLDLDPGQAGGRREARRLLAEFDRHGLLDGDHAGAVREDPPLLDFSDILPERREAIARDLRWIGGPAFPKTLREAAGAQGALDAVSRHARLLKPPRGGRFLVALGYPAATTDRPRRRMLHRLGLLPEVRETRANHAGALRVMNDVAHAAGVPLSVVDLVLGVYTGGEKGGGPDAAVCGARPDCRRCRVKGQCAYGRFLTSHGRLDEEAPARRPLVEAMMPEDRPREKLARRGAGALTDAELLAILLRTGNGREHAVELAGRLLREAGSLDRLASASLAELTRLPGLGTVKAVTIKAALELARRVSAPADTAGEAITSARTVFELLRGPLLDRRKEVFIALLLNTKNRIIRQVVVSEGTLNQSLVHPREAFQEAVRDSAAAVIFVHNHPSGDPEPSRDDKRITWRLVQAGEVMGVRVLDHVIIGRDRYYSFADEGTLEGPAPG